MSRVNIKINLPGGIVSTGDLQNILRGAESAGASSVSFGNRQQLYFEINNEQLEDLEHQFFVSDTIYEINANHYPNIISSYVSEDLFDNTGWLREGVYKDILDSFSFTPTLKINLVDSSQTFVPFFSGNLNFISSDISNYWYLYVRFPKTNVLYCWSTLIYSEDICAMSKRVESTILDHPRAFYDTEAADGHFLEHKVSPPAGSIRQLPSSSLQLPSFQIPCYEGFGRYGDKYWLGIYRRTELFSIAFLKDLCAMCIQCRIGQIYTTPWRTILIKGISTADIESWRILLVKHGIGTRHAATELNWQTEDLCESGLSLKLALAKQFDQEDLSTGDLCFAIKMNPKAGLFGSVIIRKVQNSDPGESRQGFDILHTADFNPNSRKLVRYSTDVPEDDLATVLTELCHYYADQSTSTIHPKDIESENLIHQETLDTVLQCKLCLTIYDGKTGYKAEGVKSGILFEDLPEDFCCSLCEADKSAFIEIERHKLYA